MSGNHIQGEPICQNLVNRPPFPPSSTPGCPVCGGSVIAVRGGQRCVRCCFALCQGCEPPEIATQEGDS